MYSNITKTERNLPLQMLKRQIISYTVSIRCPTKGFTLFTLYYKIIPPSMVLKLYVSFINVGKLQLFDVYGKETAAERSVIKYKCTVSDDLIDLKINMDLYHVR